MATETDSVLLTIDSISAELSISLDEARRLIAKKSIAAARIGADGPYKATAAALEGYVSKGALDARMPGEYVADQDWFTNDLTYLSAAFESAIISAAAEQIPSDADMRARFATVFADDPYKSSIDITLTNTGAIAAVLSRQVPLTIWGTNPTGQVQTRFGNWGEMFAVETFRNMARQVIMDRDPASSPFSTLYESPEDFQSIASEAYSTAAQRRVVFSKNYVFIGSPWSQADTVSRRASFLFPLSNLFTPGAKPRFVALSF
jgi:hypothetical protein